IIKQIKSPVEVDYYTKYLSSQIDISIESIKQEVYGKNYNKVYNDRKYNDKSSKYNQYNNKKAYKSIDKPKMITRGKQFVEETLIKIMLNDKTLRETILLKLDKSDFLLNESKEILKYIIKNQELDKIIIDKTKNLDISEEYLKDLESISLDSLNLRNIKSIDEIVKNVKKNRLQEQINILLEEQKIVEKNKNDKDAKEVDVKVMEIALRIVQIRKILQSL
ncbi:MAG: DNA primase, partial [Peptostreptococcaceae bacterium]